MNNVSLLLVTQLEWFVGHNYKTYTMLKHRHLTAFAPETSFKFSWPCSAMDSKIVKKIYFKNPKNNKTIFWIRTIAVVTIIRWLFTGSLN